MKSFLMRFVILVVALGVLGAPAFAQERPAQPQGAQTAIFQQGADGYSGVRDTYVSRLTWDSPPQVTRNYGQNSALVVDRDGGSNPLIAFDLTSIPPNAAVLSATLELYNTVDSPTLARRIELFGVVRAWDEGTEVDGPVNAPGEHGATGNNAYEYGAGGPPNVAWSAPGMAAPVDYDATVLATADVTSAGWVSWDATAAVRRWVRGETPNHGFTLRDITGYQDGNPDDRAFASSQTADLARRPRLVVTYNADVPYANAGPDQVDLEWGGGPVTLDGSQSSDRPGGDDSSLRYRWHIVQGAYGSALAGDLPLTGASGQWTPDAAGEWEIELVVTNGLGESATDRVHLRLLKLGAAHPRLLITPVKLAALRARAGAGDVRWQQVLDYADSTGGYSGDHRAETKALVGLISGEARYCTDAVTLAEQQMDAAANYGTKAAEAALVFDWCYATLSPARRAAFVGRLNAWADDQMADPYTNATPGWGNYWPRYSFSFAAIGLATYGDNTRAAEWLDEFREARFAAYDLPVLDHIAAGGDWPEGTVYDWIANPPRVQALEAWRTATGENLFLSTPWFAERPRALLLQNFPGAADAFGMHYHPYPSIGDAERNRGALTNYQRIMGLILIDRFPSLPAAQQLQAYLAAPQTGEQVLDFQAWLEFLFFNPDQPAAPPALTTNVAPALGTLQVRSGWPDGAADNDPSATYLTFRAGDHFSYHQHFDQGAVTIFKHSDLLLDSGVYSGDGLSYHDVNYYVRTVAHNTLLVYNPQENLSAARPDAVSNDGGQRTVYPASRSPQSEAEWQRFARSYDTGDLRAVGEGAGYVYAAGDLTKAYNNPTYNQAMDAGDEYAGNTAKVARFVREFVYLRPLEAAAAPTAAAPAARDYVVLYDRVGVTAPAYSGANTRLLFHVMTQPAVAGSGVVVSPGETLYAGASSASVTNGPGKLYLDVLAPAARNLRAVGGRGEKAFWVFDGNYDWHWDPREEQPRPVTEWDPEPYGEWRIELEPADTALDHNFLTVLQPAAAGDAATPVSRVDAPGLQGVHIADPLQNRLVLFASAPDGATQSGALGYTYRPTTDTLTLLANLPPGQRYTLQTTAEGGVRSVTLAPASSGPYIASPAGVLRFVLFFDGEVETPAQQLYLPALKRAQ